MANPPLRRWWKFWTWFTDWAWWERALLASLTLMPLIALGVGGRSQGTSAGLLGGLWFLALQAIVYRHGGWGILGPHFYYDVVRLARRGRSTFLRVAYIIAMFIGLTVVYQTTTPGEVWHQNDFARVSERFAYALFVVQNLAIFVLTPAYLGSAIAEERERRTLELLYTTQLTNKEIILGKLFSRIIHLFGFVLAGFPILSLIQFWGGIDILVVAGNLANTMLNILTLGSFCLFFSVMLRTVSAAVMTCYVLLLPPSFYCLTAMNGFPFVLQDARWGGTGQLNVQDIGWILIAHLAITITLLAMSIFSLRGYDLFAPGAMISPIRNDPAAPTSIQPIVQSLKPQSTERQLASAEEPLDDLAIPYALPPISDDEDALWWKERFVGGPPFILSPVVLVPGMPFVATGVIVLVGFLVNYTGADVDSYARVAEAGGYVLRFFFYVFLGCYLLGVANRATASIARERQQQTLDPLLLLPIERTELLRAKALGCVWRGWPWLILIAVDLLFGTLIGAYHPFSTVLLVCAIMPLIAFFALFGLLLSITLTTVMRANLVMAMVFVSFVVCMTSARSLAYLETCTFSWWTLEELDVRRFVIALGMMAALSTAAFVCWLLARYYFEDRARSAD